MLHILQRKFLKCFFCLFCSQGIFLPFSNNNENVISSPSTNSFLLPFSEVASASQVSGAVSFSFEILSDSTVSLNYCEDYGIQIQIKDLVINDTINYNSKSYTITQIGANAFQPDTVHMFGSLSLPSHLQLVNKNAFMNQPYISSINFEDCLELQQILDLAFSGCTGLTDINLSNCQDLKRIGTRAFSDTNNDNTHNLKTLSLPENLPYIDGYAFYNNANLTNTFKVPKNIKRISQDAFSGTESGICVPSIMFPWQPEEIPSISFSLPTLYNESLIYIPSGIEQYISFFKKIGFKYQEENIICENYSVKMSSLVSNPVTTDGDVSLEYDHEDGGLHIASVSPSVSTTNLEFLDEIYGKKITCIDEGCFQDNKNISGKITFGKYIKKIGPSSFSGCSNVQSIDFSKSTNLTNISDFAFKDCSNISNDDLEIPKSVSFLGIDCFLNAGSSKYIHFNWTNENLQRLDAKGANSLPSLTKNITSNGQIYVPPANVQNYIQYFIDKKITKYMPSDYVEDSYKTVPLSTICNFESSNSVDPNAICVTNNLTHECQLASIDETLDNFNNLSFFEDIKIDNVSYKLTSVADNCFNSYNISGVLSLPSSIIFIGANAFAKTNISRVEFKNNCLLNTLSQKCFFNCNSLESIDFGNLHYLSVIGQSAFEDCINLFKNKNDSLTFPKQLIFIGKDAFKQTQKINKISLDWDAYDIQFNDIKIENIDSFPVLDYIDDEHPFVSVPYGTKNQYIQFFTKNNLQERIPSEFIYDGTEPSPLPDTDNKKTFNWDYVIFPVSFVTPIIIFIPIFLSLSKKRKVKKHG